MKRCYSVCYVCTLCMYRSQSSFTIAVDADTVSVSWNTTRQLAALETNFQISMATAYSRDVSFQRKQEKDVTQI